MPATDKRVDELLDRWLASVNLHLGYLKLDDAAYARVEAWPKHQRPNALVVNLARARLLELKSQLGERRDAGDMKFAESLELMSFLRTAMRVWPRYNPAILTVWLRRVPLESGSWKLASGMRSRIPPSEFWIPGSITAGGGGESGSASRIPDSEF